MTTTQIPTPEVNLFSTTSGQLPQPQDLPEPLPLTFAAPHSPFLNEDLVAELRLRAEADELLAKTGVIPQQLGVIPQTPKESTENVSASGEVSRRLFSNTNKATTPAPEASAAASTPHESANPPPSTTRLGPLPSTENSLRETSQDALTSAPKLSPYSDFHRGSSEVPQCKVLVTMAIPGNFHRLPALFLAQVTCKCWNCRGCGPAHRQEWYETLARHLFAAISRGERVYLSWVDGTWGSTWQAMQREPGGEVHYVKMRHENGEYMLLTTVDIGGIEIPPRLVPYVLSKCLEMTDLAGRRPITTSKGWRKAPKSKRQRSSSLVGLGVVKVGLMKKVKEICRRTGAQARRWGSRDNSPRIIDGYDEAWHTFGNLRALVQNVVGIRGGPVYDPEDAQEIKFSRLWEGLGVEG